jgi:hypothetical protein
MPGATTRLVATLPIVLLGYREVPDQTPPGQMRMGFEDEAKLPRFAEAFRESGIDVETRLVFTPDSSNTVSRIAAETACTSVLLARPSDTMDSVVVPRRYDVNLDRLGTVTERPLGQPHLGVTLLHIVEPGEDDGAGQLLLEGARQRLVDAGVDRDRVHLQLQSAKDELGALVEVASGHDAIVLGETEPSLEGQIFGEEHEQIVDAFDGPVVIVRRHVDGNVPDVET